MPEFSDGRRRFVFMVAFGLFVVYVLTANYSNPYGVDAFTNAAQARAFADDQDPILEEHSGFESSEFQGTLAWFTSSPRGTTSQYPPGTAAWATPFYLFDSSYDVVELVSEPTNDELPATIEVATPSFVPASLAAALSVAIAIGFLGLTLSSLMPHRAAIASMLVAGLGTGAWSVAADKLWQHGPAMMCISAGTYLASVNRFAGSGLLFAAGILVRPHTAVIAACIGAAVALSRRSLKELMVMGVCSATGLALLLAYNDAVFGSRSVSGGYGGSFADRLVNDSFITLIGRLIGSLVHPDVGMLWTSPFLALALFALWKARGVGPDWSIGAAVGGLLYLVIQYRANRLSGGGGFFSYRYPLEALMAAAPLLALSTWTWLQESGRKQRLFAVLVAVSVVFHGASSFAV